MSRNKQKESRKGRGFILVEALVLIAVLVALMVAFTADQRASIQATQDRLRQRRSEAAAMAGIARAKAVLQDATPDLVTLNDDWAVLGSNGEEAFDLGNGVTFRVQILDAGSFVNVTSAPETQLQQLPLTQDQIDCLMDWRETGSQPRASGAKDEYYNMLPQPYNTREGRLSTVDEILLVKNWTAKDLYTPITDVMPIAATGTTLQDEDGNSLALASIFTADSGSPNTQADGSARINFGVANLRAAALEQLGIGAAAAEQIVASGPYSSFQTLLTSAGLDSNSMEQVLNVATFSTATRLEGKINLNTAPEAVLRTLPNMTQDVASAIVSRQSTGGFTSLGDMASLPGLTGSTLLSDIADYVTVGSDTWVVRAYGESGGVGTAIEAVIGLRNSRAVIETWQRVSTSGIPSWWDWDKDTTTTVDAGAAQ